MKNVMIVTGAGQISMAIARRIGYGKKIILGDKNKDHATQIAKIMNEAGFDVLPFEMDLSSRKSILKGTNMNQEELIHFGTGRQLTEIDYLSELLSYQSLFEEIHSVTNLIQQVQQAVLAINAGLLPEQLPVLIPIIIDAILSMIPVLIENLPLFIKAGYQLIIGVLTGLINAVPKLLEYIPKLIKSIVNYFKQLPEMMVEVGGNLIKGLWDGIKNLGSWVVDKIKGLGSSIMSAVKGIFGIHSPSTEFAFVGKMNMLGLEKGMEDMQPQIQKSIDGMFDLSPNLYGNTSTNLSPQVNVVNNINMTQDPLGQMVNDIKTFGGGAKNDYNYGMA